MHPSLARYLLAFSFLVTTAAVAAIDGHARYQQIAPHLFEGRAQLQAECEGGAPGACESLQNFDEVLAAFERTNTACEAGDPDACRELGIGVGLLEAGVRCDEGEASACEQLRLIELLAPACDAGDGEACRRIESLLFDS